MLGAGLGGTPGRDAFDRLFDDPEVTAAGQRLLDRLFEAPSLAPLLSGFVSRLFTKPQMLQALASLAAQSPDGGQDDLADRITASLSESVDGPHFDAALDKALDRLLDRPDVDAAFERMAEAMLERGRFVDRLTEMLMRWQPDLEAAVGVPFDHDSFEAKLEEHLGQPGRSEAIEHVVTERIAQDPGIRAALVSLLDDDAFLGSCETLVHGVVGSPSFEDDTTAVFVDLLLDAPPEQLEASVDALLVTPAIERSVVQWSDEIVDSARFRELADTLGQVLEDPNLQAELFDAVVGTPASRTA